MAVKKSPYLLLALILIAAAAFRFYGLLWEDNLPNYPHPDERHLANTMQRLGLPSPLDWSLLLHDPDHSPLNPRRLVPDGSGAHLDLAYGTLPVYLYRGTAVFLAWVTGNPELGSYDSYGLVGRTITVLLSLLAVWVVYRIGQRVFDVPTGLLGAALLAGCVLHIQLAHFMTVDMMMSSLLLVGLLFAVRFAQLGRLIDAIAMGAMLGLSMASKFNGITLGAGIAAAYVVAWLSGRRSFRDLALYGVPLTLLAGLIGFGLFEYYALRDPYTYVEAIGTQAKMVSGETDWPYTRQYVNTAPYLYQLKNLVVWGMGWPLGAAAVGGTVWALLGLAIDLFAGANQMSGIIRRWFDHPRRAGLLVLLGWALPYWIYTGSLEVKFLRYMLPLTPILCLLAAALILWSGRQLATGWTRRTDHSHLVRVIPWLLGALMLAPTFGWALAYMRVYAQEHPWKAASRWFYEHTPRGSMYTWEAWGDRLPADLADQDLYQSGHDLVGQDVWMHIYHDMAPTDKLAHISQSLRDADYVILSTPRIYLSISRLPWRYPVELRYYQLLFQEQLGYKLAGRFTAFPGLGSWQINDLSADQSFYDYDHPLVLIFTKVRDLSDQEWQQLFAAALQSQPEPTREGHESPVQLPIP